MPRERQRMLQDLGRRIRALRGSRGWTQQRLAASADLDRSYIAGLEAGLRNPSLQSIAKIAGALRITLSTLLEGVSDKSSGRRSRPQRIDRRH